MPSISAFPWDRLRRTTQVASRAAAWIDARAWPADSRFGALMWRGADEVDAAEVRRRLGEPSLCRVRVQQGDVVATIGLPWRLWRALAQAVLGDDDELAAPRRPSTAERAFAAAAVAEALARAGIDGEVVLADEPWRGGALLVELAVSAPLDAEVIVVLPAALPPPIPRPLSYLVERRGARLPDVTAVLALARGAVTGWGDVRVRDVVVVGQPEAALLVGRGAIAVALDATRAGVTVLAPYQRMSMSVSDELATDLPVPLAIVAGDVTLSARALLELAPGQVLRLGKTLGAEVELRSGLRCLARGELVDIGGELGVRVTALVDAAPPVVATRG